MPQKRQDAGKQKPADKPRKRGVETDKSNPSRPQPATPRSDEEE